MILMNSGGVGYLQVSLGGERLLTHRAPKGLVARVRSHVDLKGGTGAEVLPATSAQMLRILHSHAGGTVLQRGLLLLVRLFPRLLLRLLHLLGPLQFTLQRQQSEFRCMGTHLLGLVQDRVEGAALEGSRRGAHLRVLAEQALHRTVLADVFVRILLQILGGIRQRRGVDGLGEVGRVLVARVVPV